MVESDFVPPSFSFPLILTLLAEFRDQEDGAGERETCIAHRGVDRSGLSFGANPGAIFDNPPLFIVCAASSGAMKKTSFVVLGYSGRAGVDTA
ncbi:hypothetical protein MCOR17_000994 [Pyricularia oryzae]|nr:hypothetical protein MCOR17_000994 [Pyricularia oryzae]